MHISLQGALNQINLSWRCFEHNGKKLYKPQVVAILKAGLAKGYKSTADFKEGEIEEILAEIAQRAQSGITRSKAQTTLPL